MKSKRKLQQEKRRKQRIYTRLGFGAVTVFALALVSSILFRPGPPPAPGEAVPIMPDASHVAAGTDPGPYNTDPPTSGRHYGQPLPAGFYEAGQVPGEYPEGHIVHSLEHGYVVFWYNCTLLDEGGCSQLKSEIKSVLDDQNNFKVIAYPWDTTAVPVVATSWGRMAEFEQFDTAQAIAFVEQNRNKAPEPNAP